MGENLNQDGVITIANVKDNPDNGSKYGLNIVNHTDQPLYVSILYFDHGDLSISEWVSPFSRDARLETHGFVNDRITMAARSAA